MALEQTTAGDTEARPAVTSPRSPTTTPTPPSPAKNSESQVPPLTPVVVAPPDSPPTFRRKLAWTFAVAAAGAAAGAIIETAIWQNRRNKFNTSSQGCYEDQPNRGAPGCSSLFDDVQQSQLLAIVGYALTGGLAVGSAALFLTGQTSEPRTKSALACAPDLDRRILNCRLSF